jgi:hypothetical protein
MKNLILLLLLALAVEPLGAVVIDYSSFLGGGGGRDSAFDVAADSSGNLYAVGITDSVDFPEAFASPVGGAAVFVTRIDAQGQGIVYTTILDGREIEIGLSIAVDGQGTAYVSGQTDSNDFPLLNAFQSNLNPGITYLTSRLDAFVTKLDSSGGLVFSTYLGGRDLDSGTAIAVGANQQVYVAGTTYSNNYPLKNQFQGAGVLAVNNGFLTVLAADGQSLVYSTQLRGGDSDGVHALAVDSAGNAYVAGNTDSANFPLKGAFQGDQGGTDAFVAKINPAASGEASLVYSTYLGGQGTDKVLGIAVDAFGRAHVTGVTGSTLFPLREPLDSTNVVNEAFVTKLNAQGNDLLFSTFLGGSGVEQGSSIAVDGAGAIYVTGATNSIDFPAVNAFQPELSGGLDAFVAKIDPATSALLWSSFLGGNQDELGNAVALDGPGNVYLAGQTRSSSTFPVRNALQGSFGGGFSDGFIARLETTAPDTIGRFRPSVGQHFLHDSNTAGPPDSTVTLGQAGDLPVAGNWNGIGDRPGIFRAGIFTLKRFNNDILCCNTTFAFGEPGDLPVAGDWNGDGIDTVGVFRPSTGQFILTDTNGLSIDHVFNFGELGDLPVAGDWDGDGVDTVGFFRPADGLFALTNSDGRSLDFIFNLEPGGLPVAGDWNGDGIDTAGVLRGGRFELHNSNTSGPADLTVVFRVTGDLPLAGDWNGKP